MVKLYPGVAQLVARMVRVHEAVGSTPATRTKMNDPTQFEQVDETCEFGGAVLYSESLGITAFFENAVPSKYETQKLKIMYNNLRKLKIA